MPQKFFDSFLNNTYEFPDEFTQHDIRNAITPLHEQVRAGLWTNVLRGAAKAAAPLADMAGAAGRALGMLGQTKVQAPRILQQLTTPPQGPQTPAHLPVTPATAPGPAATLPANPYIDRNTAAMMQAPGIVPRAPVSPNDQNFAAMMPSQGAIPAQAPVQQNPYPLMDAGALNQIGNILKMMDPVQRFPKVDRATAAALGNNFQPYMQARRQDIQSQQQERRAQQEQALRERAMFMLQQRQEQERRDRLAYQQMLMDNNEREEQLALKRFQLEADRAAREEQRFQEEQRQNAIPKRTVDESTGMAYWQDQATGQIMVQAIPELQKAVLAKSGAGKGGGGGEKDSASKDGRIWDPRLGWGTMVDGVWTPLPKAAPDPVTGIEDAARKWDDKREKMLMRDPGTTEEDIIHVIGPRPAISEEAAMYAAQSSSPKSAYNPSNPAVGGRGMQTAPVSAQQASAPASTPPGPGARRMSAGGEMGWELNGMFYTDKELAAQAAGSK